MPAKAKGHYWLIVLGKGKDEVERVYQPMDYIDETSEEAVERWALAHPDMFPDGKPRQRNREKTLESIRASILYTQETRPTAWRIAKAASDPLTSSRTVRRSR